MNPIRLKGVVKNYDWGRQDADSLVYKYSGDPEFKGGKYAELWMGSHPSGPSVTEDGKTLPQIIKENNQKDIVYLFKVLSINKPLSIQTHPNKEQAE